jgi:hypothetical protein
MMPELSARTSMARPGKVQMLRMALQAEVEERGGVL